MSPSGRRIWLLLLLLSCTPLAGQVPAAGPAPSLSLIAGTYLQGHSRLFWRSLVIHPDGTFEYEMDGEIRVFQAEAWGTARVEAGTLILSPKKKKGEMPPRRLAIVRWGPRLYLAPEPEIPDFANLVNEGYEPRSDSSGFSAYLREGDWDKPVSGLPDLPAKHRPLLLAQPLEGKVLRKLGKRHHFEIDLGSREGLKPGMKLTAVAEDLEYFDCKLTVVSTTETSSVVRGDKKYCRDLPPGARVCSRRLACHEWLEDWLKDRNP